MKKLPLTLITSAILFAAGCTSNDDHGHDHDKKAMHGDEKVHLMDCAIQQTIPGAKATGAFLNIQKHGDEPLALVSASAPSITNHVEIHEMIMADGAMKMSQIMEYPLQAGDNIFKKGGYHIMLMGLGKTLAVGEKHDLTLNFSDGSSETCTAEVKSVEALTPKNMKMKGDMKHDMKGGDMHSHGDGKTHSHN